MTRPRRRILWRKIRTYRAIYAHPKVPDPITVFTLTPPPQFRTFRAAGGKRRFKRIHISSTTRKVLIVARSAKKGKQKADLVDEDLEELEELEDLDDLDDEDLDEEPEDEDDDEEDDDEDGDGLDDLTVKDLRAKARKDGHAPSAIKGLKKGDLVELIREGVEEDDEEEEEDEDDEEEEVEEAPKSKKSKSSKKGKSKPSRSRTTDGKVGVQEVAAEAGIDARKLRIYLRKQEIEKDEDTGRYEWSSMNNPEVRKILKGVASGGADAAAREGLDKLKARKEKKTGAARSKSSGSSTSSSKTSGKKKKTRR